MVQQTLKGSATGLQHPVGTVRAAVLGGGARSLSEPIVNIAFSFTHYPAAHLANAFQEHSDTRVIFAPLLTERSQNISPRQELKLPCSPTSDLTDLQRFLCTSCKCHPKMVIFFLPPAVPAFCRSKILATPALLQCQANLRGHTKLPA